MFTFRKKFLVLAVSLFTIEVLIALYAHDRIIRPYVGDYLVVMLLYCAIRTFIDASVVKTAIAVLLFSYMVEVLQYFHVVALLGLAHNRLARVIIGTSFGWTDLLAYTLGIATVLLLETIGRRIAERAKKNNHLLCS